MKNAETRDAVMLAAGLTLMTAVFLLTVYLPGRRAAARVRDEIAQADRGLRELPQRTRELQELHAGLRRRADYLSRTEPLIPRGTELHAVIAQVDRLARTHGLSVKEVKPLKPVSHESYEAFPFRMAIRGSFRAAAGFLHGLETQERLFTVEGLTLEGKAAGPGVVTEGDLNFTVYARRAELPDSAAFDASSAARAVDTGLR